MKTNLSKTIIIFIALAIAGICLVVFGQDATNSVVAAVLPLLGMAIFGSALTYILIKVG